MSRRTPTGAIVHKLEDLPMVEPIQTRFTERGVPCRLVAVERDPAKAKAITRGVLDPSELELGRAIFVNIAESRARLGENKVVHFAHAVSGAVFEKPLAGSPSRRVECPAKLEVTA